MYSKHVAFVCLFSSSHPLSLSHTLAHSLSHFPPSHIFTPSLSHTHTHTCTLSHFLPLSYLHTHNLSLSLSHTHALSHTHSHTQHTYTHTNTSYLLSFKIAMLRLIYCNSRICLHAKRTFLKRT